MAFSVSVEKVATRDELHPGWYTREFIINEIIHYVEALNIKTIKGWEIVPFENIEILKSREDLSTLELSVLLTVLICMAEERRYQNLMEKYYLTDN